MLWSNIFLKGDDRMFVKGCCSIDLYMEEFFMFPNSYIDEAQKVPFLKEKIYDVYYILYGDKYVIRQYFEMDGFLKVIVENCTKKNMYCVNYDARALFRVPDISYLNISLVSGDTFLKVEYNEKGIDFLKENRKCLYVTYCERIEENGCFCDMIHAKMLCALQLKADGIEYTGEYEVLYIGQSKRKNIFDRLNNHSKLQKIMRDTFKNAEEREIYIMIHSLGSKCYVQDEMEAYNVSIISGNTLSRSFEFENGISHDDMIDIGEAMLISHFKPEYNDKLKRDDGLEKLSTYRKIGKHDINPINFSLDLYMASYGEKMVLKTEVTSTSTKARILECCFENDKVITSFSDLPDKYY